MIPESELEREIHPLFIPGIVLIIVMWGGGGGLHWRHGPPPSIILNSQTQIPYSKVQITPGLAQPITIIISALNSFILGYMPRRGDWQHSNSLKVFIVFLKLYASFSQGSNCLVGVGGGGGGGGGDMIPV